MKVVTIEIVVEIVEGMRARVCEEQISAAGLLMDGVAQLGYM